MIRRAFTMRLKPNSLAEYKRYHDEVWPELVAEIERQGVAQITILKTIQCSLFTLKSKIQKRGIGFGQRRFTISGAKSCRSS